MKAPAKAESLDWLNRRFRPALMSFFLRRVRSHAEAEDLTQDVFLRLVDRRSEREVQNASGYVFQTAANLLRDRARHQQVQADCHSAIDALEGDGVDHIDPARILDGRESLASVFAALHELNERTRAVFVLFRFENMKQRDIAAMFGISASAVEKHIVKALAHLMNRLGR